MSHLPRTLSVARAAGRGIRWFTRGAVLLPPFSGRLGVSTKLVPASAVVSIL
jgi:hypothetical protein